MAVLGSFTVAGWCLCECTTILCLCTLDLADWCSSLTVTYIWCFHMIWWKAFDSSVIVVACVVLYGACPAKHNYTTTGVMYHEDVPDINAPLWLTCSEFSGPIICIGISIVHTFRKLSFFTGTKVYWSHALTILLAACLCGSDSTSCQCTWRRQQPWECDPCLPYNNG